MIIEGNYRETIIFKREKKDNGCTFVEQLSKRFYEDGTVCLCYSDKPKDEKNRAIWINTHPHERRTSIEHEEFKVVQVTNNFVEFEEISSQQDIASIIGEVFRQSSEYDALRQYSGKTLFYRSSYKRTDGIFCFTPVQGNKPYKMSFISDPDKIDEFMQSVDADKEKDK